MVVRPRDISVTVDRVDVTPEQVVSESGAADTECTETIIYLHGPTAEYSGTHCGAHGTPFNFR